MYAILEKIRNGDLSWFTDRNNHVVMSQSYEQVRVQSLSNLKGAHSAVVHYIFDLDKNEVLDKLTAEDSAAYYERLSEAIAEAEEED